MGKKVIDYLYENHDFLGLEFIETFLIDIEVPYDSTDYDNEAIDIQFEFYVQEEMNNQANFAQYIRQIIIKMNSQIIMQQNLKKLIEKLIGFFKDKISNKDNKLYDFVVIKMDELENNKNVCDSLSELANVLNLDAKTNDKGAILKFDDNKFTHNEKSQKDILQKLIELNNTALPKTTNNNPQLQNSTKVNITNNPNKTQKKNNNQERVEAYLKAKENKSVLPDEAPLSINFNENNISDKRDVATNEDIKNRFKYEINDSKIGYSKNNYQNQINAYREKMKKKEIEERKFNPNNFMTMDKLTEKIKVEDETGFGKECLKLTNEFRAQQNKPPLKWNDELYMIGRKHSINMSKGKVPFGHQGFNERANECTIPKKSFAENVAYNHGYNREDIPKITVDGWINSPGHRKNMLADSNICAIAAYQADNGRWYFTQLFAYAW